MRRRLASIALVALFSVAAATPATALQTRSDAATTTGARLSPASPWSLAGFWNWIESLFDEEKGQIVP